MNEAAPNKLPVLCSSPGLKWKLLEIADRDVVVDEDLLEMKELLGNVSAEEDYAVRTTLNNVADKSSPETRKLFDNYLTYETRNRRFAGWQSLRWGAMDAATKAAMLGVTAGGAAAAAPEAWAIRPFVVGAWAFAAALILGVRWYGRNTYGQGRPEEDSRPGTTTRA